MGSTEPFRTVEELISGFVESTGFKPLGPLSERHGAWEITFHKGPGLSDELDRFIVLAFVEMPPMPSGATQYDVEVWTGAEDGTHFVRRLVACFRASADELNKQPSKDAVKANLSRAREVAEQIGPADLIETYLPTRSSR